MHKFLFLFIFAAAVLGACSKPKIVASGNGAAKNSEHSNLKIQKLPEHSKTEVPGNKSMVQGVVKDQQGFEIPGAVVILISKNGEEVATVTDEAGKFSLKSLPVGNYNMVLKAMEFVTVKYGPLKLDQGYDIRFDSPGLMMEKIVIMLEKPVIYLYPDDTVAVHLQLNYRGEIIHTYPRYGDDGWHITAHPDGTLRDEKGRSYYALYWEGEESFKAMPDCGNVVAGHESIKFLENALDTLGLTERESNEFIMYWLPQLEKNPYNLIHFATTSYESEVPIEVSPQPDFTLRILMSVVPLSSKIDYPQQWLTRVQRPDRGFRLVEWGGQVLQAQQLNGLENK